MWCVYNCKEILQLKNVLASVDRYEVNLGYAYESPIISLLAIELMYACKMISGIFRRKHILFGQLLHFSIIQYTFLWELINFLSCLNMLISWNGTLLNDTFFRHKRFKNTWENSLYCSWIKFTRYKNKWGSLSGN